MNQSCNCMHGWKRLLPEIARVHTSTVQEEIRNVRHSARRSARINAVTTVASLQHNGDVKFSLQCYDARIL